MFDSIIELVRTYPITTFLALYALNVAANADGYRILPSVVRAGWAWSRPWCVTMIVVCIVMHAAGAWLMLTWPLIMATNMVVGIIISGYNRVRYPGLLRALKTN